MEYVSKTKNNDAKFISSNYIDKCKGFCKCVFIHVTKEISVPCVVVGGTVPVVVGGMVVVSTPLPVVVRSGVTVVVTASVVGANVVAERYLARDR